MKNINKVMLLVSVSATLLSGCSNAQGWTYINEDKSTSMFKQFTIDKENDAKKQEAKRSFKRYHQEQDRLNAKVDDQGLLNTSMIEIRHDAVDDLAKEISMKSKSRLCMTSALCDKRSKYLKGLGY